MNSEDFISVSTKIVGFGEAGSRSATSRAPTTPLPSERERVMKKATRKEPEDPGRKCIAGHVMPDHEDPYKWIHPDTVKVREGAMFDTYECPHCGTEFKAAKV